MSETTLPATRYARTVRGTGTDTDTGPGLLLAHGGTGSIAANYGPILDTLAAVRTVVGVDYPGSGDTPRADAPLTVDELADQLVAAGVEEGLERFAILGYSLGAAVAVRAASRHPDRVTALVLTAPLVRANARARLAAELGRDLHATGDAGLVARHLYPLAISAPALEALPEADLADALRTTTETLPAGAGEHLDLVARVDVRADLPGIAVPTLVISTTLDRLATPDLHREVAAGIPGARLVEIPTGHVPTVEDTDAWTAAITGFLATAE